MKWRRMHNAPELEKVGYMPDSLKHCVICGKDCAGQPRMKDASGRYYHNECFKQEQERQAQRSRAHTVNTESSEETGLELDQADLMDEILDDALQGTDSQRKCTSCGSPMLAHKVICMNCGFDSQSGFALEGETDFEKPQHARISFMDKASEILCTKTVVGLAVFVCIIAILLLILTISK